MKQLLEAAGWEMYHECKTCGGTLQYFRKEGNEYQVRAKIKKNTFAVILKNRIVAGWYHSYLLPAQMAKYNLT